jgi:hypothetical protein
MHFVPLDYLDIVDEHCLYLCCPYVGELKLCLSVGMGSSCRTAKHITPISTSLDTPSAAKQIQVVSRPTGCVIKLMLLYLKSLVSYTQSTISDACYVNSTVAIAMLQ